jgi:hypothetical protein
MFNSNGSVFYEWKWLLGVAFLELSTCLNQVEQYEQEATIGIFYRICSPKKCYWTLV